MAEQRTVRHRTSSTQAHQHSDYGERDNQFGVFQHADVQRRLTAEVDQRTMWEQDIADTAHHDRTEQPDQHGFERPLIVSPEHRRSSRRRKKSMDGMEKVEQAVPGVGVVVMAGMSELFRDWCDVAQHTSAHQADGHAGHRKWGVLQQLSAQRGRALAILELP